MKFRRLALLVCIGMTASSAHAWGATGHRITGTIADKYLSGVARARIQQILGSESLAEASTWADDMRSHPSPFWQTTANPWHYVTTPAGRAYVEANAPPEGDAATALRRFAQTLRNPAASIEEKQLALRFTVHLIGDLHQPLHAGRGDDRGGNEVRVTFFGNETNLHSVWDSGLVERQQLSFSEYAAWLDRRITPENVIAWSDPKPPVWIAESTAIRDQIYPASPQLSYQYMFEHKPKVDQRLQQAGVRIAAYLNDLLGS